MALTHLRSHHELVPLVDDDAAAGTLLLVELDSGADGSSILFLSAPSLS